MNPHNTCIKAFNTQWLTMTIKCARSSAASAKTPNTC